MRWILIVSATIIFLALAFTFFYFNKEILMQPAPQQTSPVLDSIIPQIVFTNQQTPIILRGNNFDTIIGIEANGVVLDHKVFKVSRISSEEIDMVIPLGTSPGVYSIVVVNPGQLRSNSLDITVQPSSDMTFTLGNSFVSLVFRKIGNSLFLDTLEDLQTTIDFPTTRVEIGKFVLRDDTGKKISYKFSDLPHSFSHSTITSGTNELLLLRWENIIVNSRNKLDILAKVSLEDSSPTAEFTIETITDMPDYSLYSLNYPIVEFQELSATQPEALVLPYLLGTLVLNPRTNFVGKVDYVTNAQTMGMQFLAYYNIQTEDLIYFGTNDPRGYYRHTSIDSSASSIGFSVTHFPENHLTPNIDYVSQYPVVLGAFKGDWYDAAKYYRSWSADVFAPRGKLSSASSLSSNFSEIDFHATFSLADDKNKQQLSRVIQEMDDFKQFFNLCPDPDLPEYICNPNFLLDKGLIELYSWQNNNFFVGWPRDYKPIHPAIFEVVNESHQKGDLVIPYTFEMIFDMQTKQYGPIVESNSLINESGKLVIVKTLQPPTTWTVPDPATLWWQDFTRDMIMLDLIDFGDDDPSYENVGFDGAYWDVFSGEESHLDYSTDRGHPQGGGDYWLQGEKQRIYKSRSALQALKPETIFESEIPTEFFINDLEFVQWNSPPVYPVALYNIPLYPAVYHDFVGISTIIASHPDLTRYFGIPIDYFNYLWAIYFTHGVFAGVSNGVIDADMTFPLASEDKPFFIFIKKLFRSYKYSKSYLVYGEMLRPIELQVEDIDTTIFGLQMPNIYYKNHYPKVPYVLSSVWKADDGSIGIVLINWWNQPKDVSFTLDFSKYGLTSGSPYALAHLSETTAPIQKTVSQSFTHQLSVPDRSIVVLSIDKDEDNDKVINSLDKCPKTLAVYWLDLNMRNGCPLPKSNKFNSHPGTTDFTIVDDLHSVSLSLHVTNKGLIQFNSPVSVLRYVSSSDRYDPLDLNSGIVIDTNEIRLDPTLLPELNIPSTLTIYGLNFLYPTIYRDGEACHATQCKILNYSDGNLTFTVSNFSTYEVREGKCGDNICSAIESCSSCSSDCGTCGGNSGGSGGSGGTGGPPQGKTFLVNLNTMNRSTLNLTKYDTLKINFNKTNYSLVLDSVVSNIVNLKLSPGSKNIPLTPNIWLDVDLDGIRGDDVRFRVDEIYSSSRISITLESLVPLNRTRIGGNISDEDDLIGDVIDTSVGIKIVFWIISIALILGIAFAVVVIIRLMRKRIKLNSLVKKTDF